MNSITYKVISDPEQAKVIWNLFSPHQVLDDEWEFRHVFVKEFNFPYHFIVGYDGDKPIGLLPLELNTVKGLGPKLLQLSKPFLEFFGGVDTDNNRVMLLPEYRNLVPNFLKQIKGAAVLTDLGEPYKLDSSEAEYATDKFELNLKDIPSFTAFVQKAFAGKSRSNMLHRIRHMHNHHQIEIRVGIESDLDLLFQFSMARFGDKSSFNLDYRRQVYKELMELFDVDLFVIDIDGKPIGIAFCIVHNKTYTLLNVGYDYELRDVGKLLVAAQIDRAAIRGCITYDAGKGDNGWKERFHLNKVPQYKLVLNQAAAI